MNRRIWTLLIVVALVVLMCVACQKEGVTIICGNCATRLPDSSQYCSGCGAKLFSNDESTAATIPTQMVVPSVTDPVNTDPIATGTVETEPIAETTGTVPSEPVITETDPVKPTEHPVIETTPTDPVHTHLWIAATCTEPQMCKICGLTSGSPEHLYANGVCTRCGVLKPSEGLLFGYVGEDVYLLSVGECTDANVVVPSTYNGEPVVGISSNAFVCCENLLSIMIPESVIAIGDNAFLGCSNLKSVTFEANSQLINIGECAFSICRSLTSIIIPNSVVSIKPSAFSDCTELEEVIFEKDSSLFLICRGTFSGCSSLKSITIPESVNNIDYGAFRCCSGLTTIIIPENVTSIGDEAFFLCTNLKNISFLGTKADWKSISFGNMWAYDIATMEVNCIDGFIGIYGNEIYPTEPPSTEPKPTNPKPTEPTDPTEPEYPGVAIISGTESFTDTTIEGDVYITSTGVVTFKNVTVTGNVYCYGKLTVSGGSAQNLYAYYWDLGGIQSSCNAWDGLHGLVKGAFKTCGSVVIKDNALDYAFATWGKR